MPMLQPTHHNHPKSISKLHWEKYEVQICFQGMATFHEMVKIVQHFKDLDKAVKICRTFDETMIREDGTVETDYYGVDTGVYARYTILD